MFHMYTSAVLLLAVCLLPACDGRDNPPESPQECLNQMTEAAEAIDYEKLRSVWENTPPEVKGELRRALLAQLPQGTHNYWWSIGKFLRLADREAFLETLRHGSDETLLGCLQYCPPSATDWKAGIVLIAERWGHGSWSLEYDAATWGSMEYADFRGWERGKRELLLELVLRSLEEHQPPSTVALDRVIERAFDVEGVAGRTVNEIAFGGTRKADGTRIAKWLIGNRETILTRDPPAPTTKPSSTELQGRPPGLGRPVELPGGSD
jgi:hypothetical protein